MLTLSGREMAERSLGWKGWGATRMFHAEYREAEVPFEKGEE